MAKPAAYSIRLDPTLRAELERRAAEDGRSLANYIERALWQHVEGAEKASKRK